MSLLGPLRRLAKCSVAILTISATCDVSAVQTDDVLAAFAPTYDKSYKVVIMSQHPAFEKYCGKGWFSGLILQNEKIKGMPGLSNSVGCWSVDNDARYLNFRYFSLELGRIVEFKIEGEATRPMKMREDAPLLYDR